MSMHVYVLYIMHDHTVFVQANWLSQSITLFPVTLRRIKQLASRMYSFLPAALMLTISNLTGLGTRES